jgi:hypothetical protein
MPRRRDGCPMERTGKQNAGTLVYPQHRLRPEDFLTFVEMSGFIKDWESLKLDVEFDLLALQVSVMTHPKGGVVVKDTGGLRKLDFSPLPKRGRKQRGKRNACRVCYVYFEEYHTVLLVMAYAKKCKDDITSDEKAIIKKAIERAHKSLSSRHFT